MLKKIQYSLLLSAVCTSSINATSLRDSIQDTLNSNPSIIAEHLNRDAYEMYIHQEEADYLPTLNLDAYLEKSKTYDNPDTPPPTKGWSKKDGWNAVLKFEHILYDGGLTPSQVQEFRYQYDSNKYRSLYTVENTILDTTNAYLNLVNQQELVALSNNNIKIHKKYLQIAQDKEKISGEVLETHQVNSKLHSVLDKFLDQENEQKKAASLYNKLVGKKLTGNICRPHVNETFLPPSLDEAIKVGVRRSYKIQEQIAKTRKQKEKIVQEKAGYKPTLKVQLQTTLDDDLALPENGREDIYSARLYLSWNLFKGGKTYYMTQKEKLFLKEEQKKLDTITDDTIDKIKQSYNTFYNLKKRLKNINMYVEDDYNILIVYKKQLADGTRTFIDILNAEAELYRANISKINLESDYIKAYYNLLFNISMLSDVILMQEKQTCEKYTYVPRDTEPQVDSKNDGLSQDLMNMFDDNSTPKAEPKKEIKPLKDETNVDSMINKIYNDDKNDTKLDSNIKVLSLNSKILDNTTVQMEKKYTINIATLKSVDAVKKLFKNLSSEDKKNLEYYKFGKNGENIKVLYGQYSSIKEAKNGMKTIEPNLLVFGAYIDNLSKHKKLKTKYAQFNQ